MIAFEHYLILAMLSGEFVWVNVDTFRNDLSTISSKDEALTYYNIIRECPGGNGYADFIFLPRKNAGSRPAMVIELKCDEGVDTAIKQIKDKGYTRAFKDYKGHVLLVGISYDKKTKKHSCKIEKL